MKLYLENGGFLRNLRHIDRCVKKLDPGTRLELYLIAKRSVCPATLSAMAAVYKQIKKITLILPAQKLTGGIIYFANKDKGLKLQLWTNREITEPVWKRICRLGCVVPIWDLSEGTRNRQLFEANRNVVFTDEAQQGIEQADIYNIAAKKPAEYCTYSSCLGKNVYIGKDGTVSYCPRYPDQTAAGSIQELDAFFEDEIFTGLLQKMIAKRNACKSTCSYFSACQAGCAFCSDCSFFTENYLSAVAEIEGIIEKKIVLSKMPLYKEQAILYKLFSGIRENVRSTAK